MTDLVRIQSRVSKKRYLNSKRTYEYGRMSIDMPKKFHEALKPFLKKESARRMRGKSKCIYEVLT